MTFLRTKLCATVRTTSSGIHNSILTTATTPVVVGSVSGNLRSYSSTRTVWDNNDEEENGEAAAKQAAAAHKAQLRKAALEYNQQKANYKKQVQKLRHAYKEEHLKHKAQDLAERDAALTITTRKRLERQRAKNERSFRNALRQAELQRQQAAVFEDHLLQQQEIREKHHQLHQRARQLLIEELETESKLWLTSKEEVDKAFDDPATEQQLWSRPQGVLGVPNPSLDSHFWTFEGHTWDRSKTYKTKSQILLEQLEKDAYDNTNVDYDTYWTPDRIADLEAKQQKAQLRANVRMAGKRALLQKQKDYLSKEVSSSEEGELPKPPPIPSLGVLGNTAAQEKEGAELLLKDPTQFFVFDNHSGNNNDEDAAYAGSSLGVPIAVRDPLRTGQPQGRVFPVAVGKLPKPDLRTEKEKKRQEREERLWAAAAGKEQGDDQELLAEEDREIGEAIDYEQAAAEWDSDDEDWNKGLDEDLDKELLTLPREFRYKEEDIDAVIAALESKAKTMQSHVQNTIRTMEQEARSRLDRGDNDDDNDDDAVTANETSGEEEEPFFDAATTQQLERVGADVEKYERLMASLTHEQLLNLFALEAAAAIDDNDNNTEKNEDPTAVADDDSVRRRVFERIPGLDDEQIDQLTELESFIKVAEQEATTTTTTTTTTTKTTTTTTKTKTQL